MTTIDTTRRLLGRSLVLAGIAATALAGAVAPAFAGECPAGQQVASGKGQKAGATGPKGVTDTVLGLTDLAGESLGIDDRLFRLRQLIIEPGGVVPWHSHENRPALIYVLRGEVTEYASTCAVPIVHKAGEVAPETHLTSHWWKNTGRETAVLLSADLFPTGMPGEEHMM
jgi:quercetin dioxygenase-like cupin family protein